MNNEFYNLKNAGPLEVSDVLAKIERSFNITLDHEGVQNATNMRSLCDLIVSKINHEHVETCTTQHAFYMLRNAMASALGADKCTIKPHSKLCQLLPRENRLEVIAEVETELGIELNLLQPKQWLIIAFSVALLGSITACFYFWPAAIAGVLASLLGLKMAGKFGKEIHLKTVGDLANKISREIYLKSRRNSVVSKNEVEQKIKELFEKDLHLQPIAVRRNTNF
jgi:hypothetical protein